MIISLIVAASENNVIGVNNSLPWRLPDDMKFFVRTTTGHHILTGRKNLESFGKVLPNRTNLVLTRDKDYKFEGAFIFNELVEAIDFAEGREEDELMIIGGGEIYQQALPLADRIYLTRVHTQIKGDVYFPELDSDSWTMKSEVFHPHDEKHAYDFTFQTFEKKK